MSTDTLGNAHRPAGSPVGGQFAPKTGAAPSDALVPSDSATEMTPEERALYAWDGPESAHHEQDALAATALKAVAGKLFPDAAELKFQVAYSDEDAWLVFDGYTRADGTNVTEFEVYDRDPSFVDIVNEVILPCTGRGADGSQIPGMKPGVVEFTFDVRT